MIFLAWSRARSRQSVGIALTEGSTSAMRRAEASTSSSGVISFFFSRATASTAVIFQSSSLIALPSLGARLSRAALSHVCHIP